MIEKKENKNKAFATITGIVTILVGLLVISGWQFNINILKTFALDSVIMKANTAVCFLFAGLALIYLQRSHFFADVLVRFFALVIMIVGILSLFHYFFGWDIGLNEILFRDPEIATGTIHPGLMAPYTALNFLMLGFAFLLLTLKRFQSKFLVQFTLIFSLSLSILGLIGYLSGLVDKSGLAIYSQMAINTSITFIILCVGMLFTVYERRLNPKTIEEKLFAGLTIVATVIIFISQVSFSGISSLIESGELVEHTQQIKQKFTQVLSNVIDVETAARGFVITGEESYGEPLRKASVELPRLLKNLRMQEYDNPLPQKILTLLEYLIDERIEFSERLCQTRRSQGMEKAISLFATNRGKIITDSIRVLIAQMITEENQFMEIRNSNQKIQSKRILIVINISLVMQMLLLAFIYVLVRREVTSRRKTEDEIRHLNVHLEERIEERTCELAQINENLSKEIEERLQIEEEKNILQQYNRGLLEASIDPLVTFNQHSLILDVNEATINVTGRSREELIGSPFPNYFTDPEKAKMGAELVFIKGEVRNYELVVNAKDGTQTPVAYNATVYKDQKGQVVGAFAAARDLTEIKLAEEEAKNAKKEAELANIAKSEFLSRMSHELRTPMNSILGFAQLMDMEELNPAHKKGVKQILKSGKHLLDLINEVLDIAKIESGKMTISTEPIEISAIVKETVDIVRHLAEMNQITLELNASAVGTLFVKADYQRLKQVLLNLITNAVKYNVKGGSVHIESRIQNNELNLEQQAKNIRISIIDTGQGITQQDLAKLFNPFERIGANRVETEGTGLGLAISKKLIEAMGGKIGVESEVDKGSTFWIELPQTESQLDHYDRTIELAKPEIALVPGQGTILYIEDNLSNIQLVEQILERHRPAIKLITNIYGRNAVQFALDYKPNLILLDLDLPDIHGSEVIKFLHSEPGTAEIPVTILSADAMTTQIKQLMKAGAEDYLVKPIDVVQFLKVVDRWI